MPQEIKTKQFLIKFAREFYKTNNAKQSAIKAGWSEKTAHGRCHTLIENDVVKQELERMEQKAREHFELSEQRVLDELMNIGFANVQDFLNYTSTGEVVFTPLDQLERERAAAINGISVTTKFDRDGNQLGVDSQLKMNDKLKALEMLGRKMGMWNDKLSVTKKVINVNLDDDDLDDQEPTGNQ